MGLPLNSGQAYAYVWIYFIDMELGWSRLVGSSWPLMDA